MKKCYYITIVAVVSICLLQVFYVISLYNRYMDENIITINDAVHISVGKEWHVRSVYEAGQEPKEQQYISMKAMDEMTPQEIDSLNRLSPIPKERPLYNVDEARKMGIAKTVADLIYQIEQDRLWEKGLCMRLDILDSIFVKVTDNRFQHAFLLYDKDKVLTDSLGNYNHLNYTSAFYPIGTKGLQYLQIKADIPLFPFLKGQVWALILSVILMIFVVLCMTYHLIVIRRKDALLQRREDSINGTIHDLKAPLNSVVTTLGWLESTELNMTKKKAIEISRAEVKHLVCNIESLLVTVRKDRKQLILKKEAIDILHLAEIVKSSMDALYRIKPHQIEIVNELPVDVKVCADGMYIENVIRNFVENALKYSEDDVTVRITLSVVGDMLQVSVRDDGWGIAPQYQKKLFQQFYQVPRGEDRVRKGYGIGLAQSKYIIDEHKGKITVESTEGEGSTFTFIIPLI